MTHFDRDHVVIPAIVTGAALVVYSYQGAKVSAARERLGIKAPATTGNPEFERLFRAHQNTLESLVTWIPSYWGFVTFVSAPVGNALGAFYVVARAVFGEAYRKDAEARGLPLLGGLLCSTTMLLGTTGALVYSLVCIYGTLGLLTCAAVTKRALPLHR